MYIYIHIPKTAGTSMSTILDHGVNRRILYDYSEMVKLTNLGPKYSTVRENSRKTIERKIKSNKGYIEDSFDVIYGHFFYDKYKDIFPDAKYLTCLRNPIDRLLSQLNHVIDERDEANELYQSLVSGNADLVDLAKTDYIGNLQFKMLETMGSFDEFRHVFILEKLPDSVYHFQVINGFKRNDEYMNLEGAASIPRVNKIGNKIIKKIEFSKKEISQAILEMKDEYEIYRLGIEAHIKQGQTAAKILRIRSALK